MAEITTTQSFADGDTVTAAKLNNIVSNASVGAEIVSNRSELTSVDGGSDFVLGIDTSSNSLRKIKPNNLTVANSITESKIVDSSISTSKIADLAVTTAKIAGNAITTAKIEGTSIISSKIADGAIITVKISNNAITTDKIEGTSITTQKIADGAVTQIKLATVFTEGTSTVEGTYGSGASVPVVVVDSKGRVISASTQPISTDVTVSKFVEGTNGGGSYYYYDQSVCFIDSNNHIRVAGTGTLGKLGVGAENLNTNSVGYMIAHCPVATGQSVSKIYVGDYSLFALSSANELYSCGYNAYGELGLGDTNNRSVLTKITGISNVSDFSISKGIDLSHAIAVTTAGAVYAWGYNNYGQLGDGTNTNRTSPTLISGGALSGKTIVKCYAFGLFSYLIDSNGDVYSCGYNGHGQLGLGDTTNRSSFTLVSDRKADAIFGQGGNTSYLTGSAFILRGGEVWATILPSRLQRLPTMPSPPQRSREPPLSVPRSPMGQSSP